MDHGEVILSFEKKLKLKNIIIDCLYSGSGSHTLYFQHYVIFFLLKIIFISLDPLGFRSHNHG
jgi:hypothetical protein